MSIKEMSAAIAAANPDMYYEGSKEDKEKFKKLVEKEKISGILEKVSKNELKVKVGPVSSFTLAMESQQTQLESIYYYLLDFVQDAGWKMEKITDNFMASPGSGQFGEIGQRVTRMQEEGMKILGGMNQVIKSVLNLIYDLKEFELRLTSYEQAKSKDPKTREAGTLALKQIWLDNVDLRRGRGSIHQMAMEGGFSTVRELFMMANSLEDLEKLNKEGGGGIVNDQVKRILIPRIDEFNKWMNLSERELKKRMSIEKNYLKSQVETIKLYSSWVRPYLKAAEELRQRGFEGDAALVNAFSTSLFELTLFGKKEMEVPEHFGNYKSRRGYYQCILINMRYRGHVSQRVTQRGDYGFAMGGRVDLTFESYSLNGEELDLVKKEMKDRDITESLGLLGDGATNALDELKDDLDHFLKDDDEKKKEEKKKKEELDINPFTALFKLFFRRDKKGKDKKEITEAKQIKKDNFVERHLRAEAAKKAAAWLFTVYDVFKKTQGMASPKYGFEDADPNKIKEPDPKFTDIFKGKKR